MSKEKLDLDQLFGFDEDTALNGAKMVIGPDKEQHYILVRKIPNDDYTLRIRELFLENGDKLELLEEIDKKEALKLDRHLQNIAIGETLIAEFGPGIVVKGKTIKFSKQASIEILDNYPDLKDKLITFANNSRNYPLSSKKQSEESVKKQ